MKYEIKLAAFEGPLDLLLHLIEKNKIDIYDIPIADLTQQYMDYINESKEFKIEIAAEFLVMAAKLMYIKSRIILPKAKPTSEDDEIGNADNAIDPREELVKRLLEYQRFQKVSKVLASMMAMEDRFVKRPPAKLSQKVLPPRNLSVDKLLKAFLSVIDVNDETVIPEVLISSEVFHVKDKISKILSELEEHDEIKLSEAVMTDSAAEKIAAFLALLELVKRQRIKAEQLIPFAEILISKNDYTHN